MRYVSAWMTLFILWEGILPMLDALTSISSSCLYTINTKGCGSVLVYETQVMEYFLIFLSVLQDNSTTTEDRPMTHWIPWLTIHSLAEDWRFDRYGIPMELYKLIQLVH